jgi:hypothetical protein
LSAADLASDMVRAVRSAEGSVASARATWIVLGALVLLAWGSSGLVPFRDARRGAMAPSDFATDFVPAARIWRGEVPGVETEEGNREAVLLGVPEYTAFGTPYRAHPPPSVMLVALLVPFGYRAALALWIALTLASVAVLAWVSADALAPERRVRLGLAAFVLIALWPPTLHNLEKGQWSVPIAGLLALAYALGQRGRARAAGALVALAGAFKIVPIVVVGALMSRERWRPVVIGAASMLAAVIALSMIVVGPAAWLDFFAASPVNAEGWQTGLANTVSIWGVLARLLIGGPYAIGLLEDGTLIARCVWIAIGGVLLAATLRAVGGFRATPMSFAAWSTLAVLMNPLGWTHTATWLVVPMALILRALRERGDATGTTALGAALVLLTLPRQTLFELAGPPPVSPSDGLFLGAHVLGAGIVLALALRAARS